MAPVCGIDAKRFANRALYATSKASIIMWGYGISQHVHGTDNRVAASSRSRSRRADRQSRARGLHPLRGQNNVQAPSGLGAHPDVSIRLSAVATPEAKARFEKLWGMELDANPASTVVEIMHAAKKGKIRGMYIMGENRDVHPDVDHAREALAVTRSMVVQTSFSPKLLISPTWWPATAWPERFGTVTNTTAWCSSGRKRSSRRRGEETSG